MKESRCNLYPTYQVDLLSVMKLFLDVIIRFYYYINYYNYYYWHYHHIYNYSHPRDSGENNVNLGPGEIMTVIISRARDDGIPWVGSGVKSRAGFQVAGVVGGVKFPAQHSVLA